MPSSVCHYARPRCCSGTTHTLSTVVLILALACLVHIEPVAASCRWWAPHSVQHVRVDGFIRLGIPQGCGAGLINVSVTFFAQPQSTIVLDGWSMRQGGSVAIAGPPDAPWSIRDVAVIVRNSVIEAVDGPAVSVALGVRYKPASAFDVVSLRNVSLYCNGSRLWSSSNASGPRVAETAVLSVTLSTSLVLAYTIDAFSAVAFDSDLRSIATAASNAGAAVASITAARNGVAPLTVSDSVLHMIRCNATAVTSSDVAASAAVAGIAFGWLSSTGLTVSGTTAVVVNSSVTARSITKTTSACVVAGVAVGYADDSPLTIGNGSTFFVGWSDDVSSGGIANSGNVYAASSVAGVALGYASRSSFTIARSATFCVTWCSVTSTSDSFSSSRGSNVASIAGVAVGSASSSPITIANGTIFYVAWSHTFSRSSSSVGGAATAASTVAGVAVGCTYTGSPFTAAGTTHYLGWCNATSRANAGSAASSVALAYGASSVAGVAVGIASAPVTTSRFMSLGIFYSNSTSSCSGLIRPSLMANDNSPVNVASAVAGVAVGSSSAPSVTTFTDSATLFVGWSNAVSITNSSSGNACLASSVAGIAVGYAYSSPTTVTNTTASVLRSVASSVATSAVASSAVVQWGIAYAASAIAGVAVASASASSPITIANGATFYVAWSHAFSRSSVGSAAYAACAVAGVAVARTYDSSAVTTADITTFDVGWSNVSSSSNATVTKSSSTDSCLASSVAGIAVGYAYSSPTTVTNTTASVLRSVASSVATSAVASSAVVQWGIAYAASAIAGVAMGVAGNFCPVNITNGTLFSVIWSNATTTSTSAIIDTFACAAGSVAGVAVARAFVKSPVTIGSNAVFNVGWSNVTSMSTAATIGHFAFAACNVAGVAVAQAFVNSPVTIGNYTTFYVGWSNATSIGATATENADVGAACSVAGVALANVDTYSPITIDQSTTFYVGWSNTTSTSKSNSSTTLAVAASSVAGVAVAKTDLVPSTAAVDITSAADVSAFATVWTTGGSRSGAVACLLVPSWTTSIGVLLSCGLTAPVNATFPTAHATSPLPVTESIAAMKGVLLHVPAAPLIPWSLRVVASVAWRPTRTRTATANTSASRSLLVSWSASQSGSRTASPRDALESHSDSQSRHSSSQTAPSTSSGAFAESESKSAASSESLSVSPSQVLPRSADLVTTPLLKTATVSVAVVSAVVSVGSLTSGANAGRISVLLRVASCGAGDGDGDDQQQASLPWSSHPLGFGVSSAGPAAQYDAGAVLGNTAIAVTLTALHLAATCMRLLQCRGRSNAASGLARAVAWARFPGLSSTVHLYLMPLVAQSAVSCIARGTGVGVVIGVWALLVLASVVACLTYHTVRTLAERMECSPPGRGGWLEPVCEWRARGSEASSTAALFTPEQLCACFGAYFEDYHYASRWWLTIELTVALVSAMIGGLMDTSVRCVVVQAIGVVPNVVYLALLLWRRPHQRRLDMATCTAVGTLLLAGAVALCAGSTDASTAIALAASAVGFVPALCTPYKLAQQLRTMRRLKQQRREGEKRHQALLLSQTDDMSKPEPCGAAGRREGLPCSVAVTATPLQRSDTPAATTSHNNAIGRLLDELLLRDVERVREGTTEASSHVTAFDLDALLADSLPPAQQQRVGGRRAVDLL